MTTRAHDEALQRELRIVWLRYVVRTEEYDRTLPGSWVDHPIRQIEWQLTLEARKRSYDFARRQRTKAEFDAASFGVSLSLSDEIRTWADRLDFERAKELLAWLEEGRDEVQAQPAPPPHLLPLALEALESSDAREVLGDAIQETGWADWRLRYLWLGHPIPREAQPGDVAEVRADLQKLVTGGWSFSGRVAGAAEVHIRSVVAVLLFGGWIWGGRWPLIDRDSSAAALFAARSIRMPVIIRAGRNRYEQLRRDHTLAIDPARVPSDTLEALLQRGAGARAEMDPLLPWDDAIVTFSDGSAERV